MILLRTLHTYIIVARINKRFLCLVRPFVYHTIMYSGGNSDRRGSFDVDAH